MRFSSYHMFWVISLLISAGGAWIWQIDEWENHRELRRGYTQ